MKNKYAPKKPNLRIYWNSNAPWSFSGYGNNTDDILTALVKEKYDVACGCFYGLDGNTIDYKGIKCYPRMGDTWGVDGMVHHAKDFNAQVVFSHQDIWPLNPHFLQQIKAWIPYLPIDTEPVNPHILDRLRFAYRIVVFTKFGHDQLAKNGFYSTIIPHAIRTDIFKPMDKLEMRKRFGLPQDAFIFGMFGANKEDPPRKGFQQALDAFAELLKKHNDLYFYVHSDPNQQGGFDIPFYAKHLGITDRLIIPDSYDLAMHSPDERVAMEYNMLDCLLQPSTNEGFGIPIIEAQGCGVPVIVNNWTAMPELVQSGVTGEIADSGPKRWVSNLGGYIRPVDADSLLHNMESVYVKKREFYSDNARKWILENYDFDKTFKGKWLPFMQKVEQELCK